jgi:hypothetical protein
MRHVRNWGWLIALACYSAFCSAQQMEADGSYQADVKEADEALATAKEALRIAQAALQRASAVAASTHRRMANNVRLNESGKANHAVSFEDLRDARAAELQPRFQTLRDQVQEVRPRSLNGPAGNPLDDMKDAAFATAAPEVLVGNSNSKTIGGQTSGQITAMKDGGNATLKFAPKNVNQLQGVQSNITISTPLSKDSDAATKIATLDGLADATTIAFTYARLWPIDKSTVLNDHVASQSYLWGVTGRVGVQSLSYDDQTTLAKHTSDKKPASGSLFAGRTFGDELDYMLIAKFTFQDAYKNAKTGVLCPLPSVAPTKCVNDPIGTPVHNLGRIVSLEGRHVAGEYDIQPVISYDTATHVRALDVPIYLVGGASTDGSPVPFNAGIDVGWRSDTHGTVGIFIGAPFSFWDTPK